MVKIESNKGSVQIMALATKDVDRGIAQGREDFHEGLFEEVNAETTAKLLAEITQELSVGQ